MISFAYESLIFGTVIIAAAASGLSYLFLTVLNNPFLEATIKTPLLIVIGVIDTPLLLFVGFAVISGVLMLLLSILGGIVGFIEMIFDHLTGAHAHRKKQNEMQIMSKENYIAANNLESEKLKAERDQNISKYASAKRLLRKCGHIGCQNRHKEWTYVSGRKTYLCKEHYQDYRNKKTIIDEYENIEAIAVLSRFLYDLSNRKPDNDFAVKGNYYSHYKRIQEIKGLIEEGAYSRAVSAIQSMIRNKAFYQRRIYYPLIQMLSECGIKPENSNASLLYLYETPPSFYLVSPDIQSVYLKKSEFFDVIEALFVYNANIYNGECFKWEQCMKATEWMIEMIRADLVACPESLPHIKMSKEFCEKTCLLPLEYQDENGQIYALKTTPYESAKMSSTVPVYFEYIDLIYFFNKNTGFAPAQYTIQPLFEHIRTNGGEWINVHTGEAIAEVMDFRIATIYELYRLKYLLNQSRQDDQNVETIMKGYLDQVPDYDSTLFYEYMWLFEKEYGYDQIGEI